MSEEPELAGDEALAAERALGVLTDAERAAVEARAAAEPDFAALIEDWGARLAPMLSTAPAAPAPEGVWRAVERRLPANGNLRQDERRRSRALNLWRAATVGAMLATAASLALAVQVANRPPVVLVQGQPTMSPLMSASLAAPAGKPMFVCAYDPERKALMVTSLFEPGADPGRVHELWLIPPDGKPRSLGFVTPGASAAMPMAETVAPMFKAGSALAVSVEPMGGSPGGAPSGPIAAKGTLKPV